MKVPLLLLFLLVASLDVAWCAKILAFYPIPSHSHTVLKSVLLTELAARGHHVTVVSPAPEKKPISNYTDIVVPIESLNKLGGGNTYDQESNNIFEIGLQFWKISGDICTEVLSDSNVQKLINSKNLNFDLIIMEAFFSECFIPFGLKFKAPIIKFCTFGGTHWMGDWVGNPNPYSYVPDVFLDYSDSMNSRERLFNTISGLFFGLGRQFYYLPKQDEIVRPFFKDSVDLPLLSDLDRNSTSLLLVNSHFSIDYPRPLMPNIIQVGGLHIKPPKKLPEDIQKYLDDAPHGVVYFSMGSILKSSELPDSKKQAFLEAFSKLKQKVLWKWEDESLPGQPKNVKLAKWLPQSDILAHPNVRLFISHGGLLSSQEAISRGVPMVGIPIVGDQKYNLARAVSFGYGIILDFKNISTDSVTWALKEGLENPTYSENAQRLSRIYQDQPLSPIQQAVFWTEYVIRHKGAPHMRSAVLDLYWYQYFLLDVIAVLLLVSSPFLAMIIYFVRRILRVKSTHDWRKDPKDWKLD